MNPEVWGENICPTCKFCQFDKYGRTVCSIFNATCYRYNPCWHFQKKESEE